MGGGQRGASCAGRFREKANDMENDSSIGGFLSRALDVGLGFIKKDDKPKPAAAPKPPEWQKWALIGAGVLALVITFRLITKK